MLTHFLLFEVDKATNDFEIELARREICWLVKNKLVYGTPAGRGQLGFSFVRAQVELPSESSLRSLINEPVPMPASIRERLEATEPIFFSVPLRKMVDTSSLQHRLSFSSRVLSWNIEDKAPSEEFLCGGEFWNTRFAHHLVPHGSSNLADRAIFNIAHPFDQGVVATLDDDVLVDVQDGTVNRGIDSNVAKTHVITTLVSLTESSLTSGGGHDISAIAKRISAWALPGTSMSGEPKATGDKEAGLTTGALSAANIIYRIELAEEAGSKKKHGKESLVSDIVKANDAVRLSIHLYLEDRAESVLYLGFKKIPRDRNLEELGPRFDPSHEVRKLKLVEYIRNTHPGFKGPFGDRSTQVNLRSGWTMVVTRPGFKDCEDFRVHLEGPNGEHVNPYFDEKPDFETIFKEARIRLLCEHFGGEWLLAVYRLWLCEDDTQNTIESVIDDYLATKCDCDFEYDDEAFLWLIHLLFIEEDMNYRFWYHPPLKGLKYRKQGRDMPMNAILRLVTELEDPVRPQQIAERTRESGGLVRRPTSLGFGVPKHLIASLKRILRQ